MKQLLFSLLAFLIAASSSFATVIDVTSGSAPADMTILKATATNSASERIVSSTFDISFTGTYEDTHVTLQIMSASPEVRASGAMDDLSIQPEVLVANPGDNDDSTFEFWSHGHYFDNHQFEGSADPQITNFGLYTIEPGITAQSLRFVFNFKEVKTDAPGYTGQYASRRWEYYVVVRINN